MIKANKDLYNSRINKKGMEYIFEILDKNGRKIHLSKERWSHIVNDHPEISNRLEEIRDIVKNPLIIKESKDDENVRHYYKYYKNLKQKAKNLLVSVKYLNGHGYIITSFYVDKIKK